MRWRLAPALGLALLLPGLVAADSVLPSERVRSRVVVRERADRGSPEVGSLRPGERVEYLGAVAGWRRVRLADGTAGFVSQAWTRIEGGAEPSLADPHGPRSGASGWLAKLYSRSERPQVELVIRDPGPETHR